MGCCKARQPGIAWLKFGSFPVPPICLLQSFKDDVDLKQDLRCDTVDTREEYELKVRGRLLAPASSLPTCLPCREGAWRSAMGQPRSVCGGAAVHCLRWNLEEFGPFLWAPRALVAVRQKSSTEGVTSEALPPASGIYSSTQMLGGGAPTARQSFASGGVFLSSFHSLCSAVIVKLPCKQLLYFSPGWSSRIPPMATTTSVPTRTGRLPARCSTQTTAPLARLATMGGRLHASPIPVATLNLAATAAALPLTTVETRSRDPHRAQPLPTRPASCRTKTMGVIRAFPQVPAMPPTA